jgi:hypothetical protein
LSDFNENLIFSTDLKKNTQIANFMKIHPVGAKLFHAGRQVDGQPDRPIDRNDEANSCLSQFCERTYKLSVLYPAGLYVVGINNTTLQNYT